MKMQQNAKCYCWSGNYPLQPRLSLQVDYSSGVSVTYPQQQNVYITLNKEAQADIQWWISFFPSGNGTANFLDQEWTDADSLQLYTDASGRLGFTAYWAGEWIRGDWLPHQQLPLK